MLGWATTDDGGGDEENGMRDEWHHMNHHARELPNHSVATSYARLTLYGCVDHLSMCQSSPFRECDKLRISILTQAEYLPFTYPSDNEF